MSHHLVRERRRLREWSGPGDDLDLFIGAVGAADRAYRALELTSDWIEGSTLLFNFRERRSPNGRDYVEALTRYEGLVEDWELLDCSIHDRRCAMPDFRQELETLRGSSHVGLDISVFTKPYFFAVLRCLRDVIGVDDLTIFYTEPLTYQKEDEGYELTEGGYDLSEIPGFSGELIHRQDQLLVIMLGFEGRVARMVDEEIAPSTTVLINGFPSYLLHYKDTSRVENSTLLDEVTASGMLRMSPAHDPFETFNQLESVRAAYPDHSLTIAPLGTKPMALGAAFFGLSHREARVTFPWPDGYPNKTSESCGASWVYRSELA